MIGAITAGAWDSGTAGGTAGSAARDRAGDPLFTLCGNVALAGLAADGAVEAGRLVTVGAEVGLPVTAGERDTCAGGHGAGPRGRAALTTGRPGIGTTGLAADRATGTGAIGILPAADATTDRGTFTSAGEPAPPSTLLPPGAGAGARAAA